MFTIKGEPHIVTETREKILKAFEDLEFYEEGHKYLLHGQEITFSVSGVGHRFIREPFNEKLQAARYAQKHGKTAEYWIKQWKCNSFRATTLGTKTHAYGESLGYLKAGHPELICPMIRPQYNETYNYLAPIHPKEEAVLKFMDELPDSYHLVLNETKVYSGKNPDASKNCLSLKNVESKNVIKDGKTTSPNAVRPSRVGKKTKEPRGQTSNGRSKTQDSSSKSCGSCAAYQIK